MMETSTQATTGNIYLSSPNAKKIIMLVGIYVAILGSLIQSNTMSTMLPLAAAEIGGTDYYSLASNISGVVGIILMPLWGYLCARAPQIKTPLFAVSMIVGALTVFCRAIAPNMLFLIVTNSLYGLVSCAVYVVGYSLIRDMYPAEKAGTLLGACGTIMMLGALIGPVFGGWIMTTWGWRVLCWVIWPMLALGGIIPLFGIRAKKGQVDNLVQTNAKFDVWGTIFMALFTGLLVLALSLGTSFLPFGGVSSNVMFAAAAVSLVIFIIILKKKGNDAIIPLDAFKDRNSVCYILGNFFSSVANMAIFFFLPLYVLRVMQLTPTESGIIMACYSIVGLFLSPIFGRVIGKTGSAKGSLAVVSVVRIIVALLFIFFLTPTTPIWVVCIFMLIGGIYNCAGGSIFSAGPQVQLKPEVRAQGNAVIQQMQTFGSSIGIATFTACIGIAGMEGGFTISLIISIVCAAGAFITALGLKKLPASDK